MYQGKLLAAAAAIATFAAAPAAAVDYTVDSDPVLFWNDLAIKTAPANAANQARIIAAMNTAIHDAVSRSYNGADVYYNQGVSAPGGDVRAAVSVAARNVLASLNGSNPTIVAMYDAALSANLAKVPDGTAKTNGIATGNAYSAAMLLNRMNDGSTPPPGFSYTPGNLPGQWRPTPPGNLAAAIPFWGQVKPFLLSSGAQFRPDGPPDLDSAEYLAAYNEVKEIGAKNSATRTEDQRLSALFWDVSNGTTWNRIGLDLISDDNLSTLENSRVMAKLSTAVADALIAGFDAKYTYNFWRPVTAIREGDNDGVDGTVGDANWESLFAAPNHPSYPSTHSLQSGAASAVLLALVKDQAFCNQIGPDMRCFDGIADAAQDAANSRLWGGIHFRFDNEIGLATGQTIGRWALAQNAFNAVPEPASWALMIAGFGLAGAAVRRRVVRVAYA
ncbi:PEPxxWA-CTERM sorting domain-containing protein [Sphingomonas sp. ID1715]|uniref:PEPxxWA-CTERM sorting domain-containing protein n=1 Tax=Sphingomonas sp. ID1715 TaxID=1656898 RepID=UPI0020C48159|nr:PEPxxWA-CTERM sorting domain-containing protein [Sphingomonas sp. ID1715]